MGDALFSIGTPVMALIVTVIVVGLTLAGSVIGHRLRGRVERHREPLGVLQGALLGLVALLLAFGMTMAVGRYDARRAAVVDEANAIGTTWLRAQLLREPHRERTLDLLRRYTDEVIAYSNHVPGSDAEAAAIARAEGLQGELWAVAGAAIAERPQDSAPKLYIETLNETIDMETVHIAALNNRVPATVLIIEVLGAAIALGLLATYLSTFARSTSIVVLAAGFVAVLLIFTIDLDRPTRGMVTVPDTALVDVRAAMDAPPAARAPSG